MFPLDYNQHRGFTLIELIMTMVILGIMSGAGYYLTAHFVRGSIYIPRQLSADMIVAEALHTMIEGDVRAKGLRFSRAITRSGNNRVDFISQDGETVAYRINGNLSRLERSINGGSWTALPYYVTSAVTMTGEDNILFAYYNGSEAATSDPALVRRVAITLTAQTGDGAFASWEARAQQRSSVAVPRYQ